MIQADLIDLCDREERINWASFRFCNKCVGNPPCFRCEELIPIYDLIRFCEGIAWGL